MLTNKLKIFPYSQNILIKGVFHIFVARRKEKEFRLMNSGDKMLKRNQSCVESNIYTVLHNLEQLIKMCTN